MKITIFTSNKPRHISLINSLSEISDEIYCIQECTTLFPGKIDDFFKKTPTMGIYFENVLSAEYNIFGSPKFTKGNIRSLAIRKGDLNNLGKDILEDSMHSDVYIVFGASYLRGWLVDYLVAHDAINIHMGLSPYYRGSSCNFWALYDDNPHYVGATIHKITKGLDDGPILYHCIPVFRDENIFDFTMKSVQVAHLSLVDRIRDNRIFHMDEISLSKSDQIRYTRNAEFTDSIVESFLARGWDKSHLSKRLLEASYPDLVAPYFGG